MQKPTDFDLTTALQAYTPVSSEEIEFKKQFLELLATHPHDCYYRELPHAHLTGSAWIINEAADHVLLMHHRKLDKWLQPGGHADGDRDICQVASKEANEETGVQGLRLMQDGSIFDLDIHRIPERKGEPAHFHFDVRFLFSADYKAPFSRIVRAVAWPGSLCRR